MTMRAKKYIVAGFIAAAMVLGHFLERYVGWDGAFMIVGGIGVAIGAAWVVVVILGRRRR